MPAASDSDVMVVGTGPAGLVTALLAAEADLDVQLVGPAVNTRDARTTTLMLPALETLRRLGIDTAFDGKAAALEVMRIIDGTRRLIRSPVATFHASEIGESHFGMNIPNATLNKMLFERVSAANIVWHEGMVEQYLPDSDGVTVTTHKAGELRARLVAAADGRNSAARAAAGLRVHERRYRQSAFVAMFSHEKGHGGISTEFHTETGPFTIVPLPGNRSSLVWVVRPDEAEMLVSLSQADLSRRIEDRMDSMLGKVVVEGHQQIYPLASAVPSEFATKRIALIGEAAHIFPPIGAQGLNLGIRDAVDLVNVASSHRADPGSSAAMAAYNRARRPDILARTGAVSLLNQSLLSNLLPAQFARSAGLAALSGISPLRGFFMREGMRPGSGFLALMSSVRGQLGRGDQN